MAIDDIPDYPDRGQAYPARVGRSPQAEEWYKEHMQFMQESMQELDRIGQQIMSAPVIPPQPYVPPQQPVIQQQWRPRRRGIPKMLVLVLFAGFMTFILLNRQGWPVGEAAVNSLIATAIVIFGFWYAGKL